MEYMHGGDIYTYENVTDYSVNLNPFGPGEEVLLAMAENLKHAVPSSNFALSSARIFPQFIE